MNIHHCLFNINTYASGCHHLIKGAYVEDMKSKFSPFRNRIEVRPENWHTAVKHLKCDTGLETMERKKL